MKGSLYLIPVTLGNEDYSMVIPAGVSEIVKGLRNFVVEDIRSARRFLRTIDRTFPIDDLNFYVLNEHTTHAETETLISIVENASDVGLMSEAGVPCVADPGSPLIKLAHRKGIRVIPLTGPSSILLALMASGLNGQNFKFNGYIPIKTPERIPAIKQLEKDAEKGISQIFIEAPYRNQKLLEDILRTCKPEMNLCIAVDITAESEYIRTQKIKDWKRNVPAINKRPAIFIIGK